MKRVQTPQGVGYLTTAAIGQDLHNGYDLHVVVPGLPAIRYDAATMPVVQDLPRQDVDPDAWIREHSNRQSQARNERRVNAWRRKKLTPSKLATDKLIGQHVRADAVVAAKIYGGYVIEHQDIGYLEVATPKRVRDLLERAAAETSRKL